MLAVKEFNDLRTTDIMPRFRCIYNKIDTIVELVRSASTLGRLLLNCRLLLDRVFFFFNLLLCCRDALRRRVFFAAPPSTMLFTYASIFRITKLIQILSILGGLASDCTSRSSGS
jgi:hypothetical protein